MSEKEYKPNLPEDTERGPQGTPPFDVWMVSQIQQEKQRLGKSEAESINPFFVIESLSTYRKMVGFRISDQLKESLSRVRDVYEIVAYPYFDDIGQYLVNRKASYGPPGYEQPKVVLRKVTLSDDEKSILQKITNAMGIPDDPQQRTYSFADLPQPQMPEGLSIELQAMMFVYKSDQQEEDSRRYRTSDQYYEDTINSTIEKVRNEGLPVIEKSPEQIRQEVAGLVRENMWTAQRRNSERTFEWTRDSGRAFQASLEFEKSPWYIQQRQRAEKIEQGDLSETASALNEYIRGRAGYISMGGGNDAESVKRKRQEFAQQLHDLQTLQTHADNLKK